MHWTYSILQLFSDYAEAIKAIGSLGTLIAALLALIKYRTSQREQAQRHEQAIFDSIEASYFELNKVMLDHPNLDVSWFTDAGGNNLSDEQRIQQYIIFDMTVRLFERAYLVFRRAGSGQRDRQWRGWDAYIEDYCKKKSFSTWWNTREWPLRSDAEGDLDQYDTAFVSYLNTKMQKADVWRASNSFSPASSNSTVLSPAAV